MRIAPPPASLPNAPREAPTPTGSESAAVASDGFAQLLASMLRHGGGERTAELDAILQPVSRLQAFTVPDQRDQGTSAQVTPQIGSSSLAFERGQLLVETACALPRATGSRLTMVVFSERTGTHPSTMVLPGAPNLASGPLVEAGSLSISSAAWAIGRALPYAADVSLTGATAFLRAAPIHNAALPQLSPIARSPATPPETSPTVEPGVETGGKSSAERAHNAASRSEPFSARLIAADGTLRVLLRLPRLDDGEKARIETGLTRLLTSFGHRRHDLVIHETGRISHG